MRRNRCSVFMNNRRRNWLYLFTANFFGILNDNFIKHCLVFVAVLWSAPSWLSQSQLISAISAALVIPYLLFSPLSGKITVLYSKQTIFRVCKLAEFPIVALAIVSFLTESVLCGWLSVLLMGIQSCMYSPSKYGLIRDIGGKSRVNFGSGVFETMAFLAILVGTSLAAYLSDHYHPYLVGGLFFLFAVLGCLCCFGIHVKEERTVAEDDFSTINPIKFIVDSYRYARQFKGLNAGVFGVSVFWLMGGLLQMNLVLHCTHTLAQSNTTAGIVMAIAATGIALGCTIGGKIGSFVSDRTLVFVGLSVMILCLAIIVLVNPNVYICAGLVFVLAFMGGCFEIPCLAMIQKADTGQKNGQMLAYMNLITFVFVLLGSFIFSLVTSLTNENSLAVFIVIAFICLLTLLYFVGTTCRERVGDNCSN